MAGRIQRAAAERTGIPAGNIHLVATHDHSMPTFKKIRQWGGMSPEFMATVEERTVEAIAAAGPIWRRPNCRWANAARRVAVTTAP